MSNEPAVPPSVFRVSEMFRSIQGEGASAGAATAFVRLAHCNLRCRWCDTRYTWDWEAFRYEDEVRRLSVDDVLRWILDSGERRLVVTGGEPLLQQTTIAALLALLPSSRPLAVEVETNGTVMPQLALLERVDQWNVSPKLAGSGEPEERRLNTGALTALRDTGRAWLKLVVAEVDDGREVDALIASLAWPRERVLLMPEATTPETLLARAPRIQDLAMARGVGVSPRLHVLQFGGQRGR